MVHLMKRGHERRKYPRFEVSFPVNFRVSGGSFLGVRSAGIEGIGTRTTGNIGNVSLEGLFIEANPTQDQINQIIRAKRDEDRFDIEIETHLMGQSVKMIGKVVWYDINFMEEVSYHFRAGVFLEDMDRGTRQIWERVIAQARN